LNEAAFSRRRNDLYGIIVRHDVMKLFTRRTQRSGVRGAITLDNIAAVVALWQTNFGKVCF